MYSPIQAIREISFSPHFPLLLVYNLTFKVKCGQNRREIPSLPVIIFGICEIFAILNFPNIVSSIDNVTAIAFGLKFYI